MRTLLFLIGLCLPVFSFAQKKLTDSLEQVLLTAPPDTNRLEALNTLSFKYKYSNPERAFEFSEEAEQLALQLNDRPGLAKTYYCRAYIHYPKGEHDEALQFLNKSLKIAEEEKLISRQAYCHGVMAMVYGRLSDYDKALKHNLLSADFFKKTPDTLTLAAIVTNTGTIYEERGQYDTALVFYFESLKYKTESGNRHLATTELANIGACYTMLGEYDLSLDYNRQGLSQAKTTSNLYSHLMANRGNTFLKMEQLDSALTCGLVAYELDREKKVPYFFLNSTKLLGEVYEKMGKPELASQYYEEGLATAKEIKNLDFQASIGCRLGNLHFAAGKLNHAKIVLENAFQMAEELNAFPHLECTASNLSKVFEALGNYQQALFYHKKSEAFRDSIAGLEKSVRVVELEKQYRTEQQAKQIAQQDLTIAQQSTRQRNLIIGALAVFLLLFGVFQFLRYRLRLRRQEAEYALELEKAKARQLEEVDQLKSNFFANISHEFRTPLTLILNPLKKMLEGLDEENASSKNGTLPKVSVPGKYIQMMSRNAERLLQLINELLDLSKLESGSMQLRISEGDIVQHLRTIVFSFESLAERRQIHFQTEFPEEHPLVFFDKDKVEKIVNNLLSNAFKFTSERGKVAVEVLVKQERLRVSISDSGKGIPKNEVNKIFDRFYQVEGTEDKGTGIGLSLVKELVELHKGQISVSSEVGKGTRFKVSLPVGRDFFDEKEIQLAGEEQLEETGWQAMPVGNFSKTAQLTKEDFLDEITNQPILLIVEDNPDLRNLIVENLKDKYQIIQAENGEEGFEKAIETIPDLIISDVMMPKMSGNEMCKQLKTNDKTSHIPIILLTAKAGVKSKIEGLETGADDYLTKPFDEKELRVRVQNLIEQRRKLRVRFSKEIKLKPKDVAVTSADEKFLNKVITAIEDNMGDSTFGVETLSKIVGMSRSQLHRKLNAVVGQAASMLIRNMRLERGKTLLENGAGTVSEIAYEVGFSSPAYFTKCFHDQFGVAPSGVKQ